MDELFHILFKILSNSNITNSRFNRNTAKGDGGAIYLNISNTTVLVERQILTDCNFTENTAVNCGALYCDGFYRITDGTFNFIKNSAKANGGAVYCGDSSYFVIVNLTTTPHTMVVLFYVKRSMRLHIPSSPEITPIWDLPYIQMISAMLLITLSF